MTLSCHTISRIAMTSQKYIFFIMVLPQFLDFLGVGDVLVRANDHAVLLVHELVHLETYPLDGGLHLLAVDIDGYPAGAALCHKR